MSERPPSNAELIAELQAVALLFRMFSLDEIRQMQAAKPTPPGEG
jgi:hypothetical protein